MYTETNNPPALKTLALKNEKQLKSLKVFTNESLSNSTKLCNTRPLSTAAVKTAESVAPEQCRGTPVHL